MHLLEEFWTTRLSTQTEFPESMLNISRIQLTYPLSGPIEQVLSTDQKMLDREKKQTYQNKLPGTAQYQKMITGKYPNTNK